MSKKANPGVAPHLTVKQLDQFADELDEVLAQTRADLGAADAAYIRRVIRQQRWMAVVGRSMQFSALFFLPALGLPFASGWFALAVLGLGTLLLAAAKILENMEIGHNIMHGQWDWMGDAEINSRVWEWDHACPSRQWKHTHNVQHHCWANVMGLDRDIGYGTLRVTEAQRWQPYYWGQPIYNVILALLFDWAIAIHDVQFDRVAKGRKRWAEARLLWFESLRKMGRQGLKDFVLWPLLAGPFFFYIFTANIVANVLRNIWTYMIIFCGHFPEQARVFSQQEIENESRGQWYARQLMASCNIDGGPWFHLWTGNLSFQVEHHLFPDLASNRYQEIAPRVREICGRYNLPYNSGPLFRQFASTTSKIIRLARPGKSAQTSGVAP